MEAPAEPPLDIVDLDAVIESESRTPEETKSGVSFWFGEVGVFKFDDGTSYHASRNRAFITDPKLIANLKTASQNKTSKIIAE